jgi:hypothetical protein
MTSGKKASHPARQRRWYLTSKRRWALTGLSAISVAVLAVGVAFAIQGEATPTAAGTETSARADLGAVAPEFTAGRATAGRTKFRLAAQRGHLVLLSFLDTEAQASANENPSREQIVFLKSMETQSRQYGLRIVIVDAARLATQNAPSQSDLINFTYDWALPSGIAVVGDTHGALARTYGIEQLPTTLLIDKKGIIRARWTGFASAAKLDFAIRALEGRSIVSTSTTTRR